MSQRQSKYITSSAFPEPNYTQTPNNFFDMLPDMEHSEVNVTLVVIRETFGYHRKGFKMGINKLAKAAGLSRNAAKDGAEAAERRGTFRRSNPNEQTEAEWELVVGQPMTTSANDQGDSQPEGIPSSTTDSQVGVKESLKKDKNKIGAAAPRKANHIPEVLLYREVTHLYPPRVNFDDVVESVSKVRERLGREVTRNDLLTFYQAWCHKGYKPTNLAWLQWAETGQIPANGNWKPREPQSFAGIREFLKEQNVESA